jgi:hypothetical protein
MGASQRFAGVPAGTLLCLALPLVLLVLLALGQPLAA